MVSLSTIAAFVLIVSVLILMRKFFAGARCKVFRDLYNNIIIITGSSSGIGLETARALAKQNATIIFACRNEKKTQSVIDQISKETGNSNLHFMELDFEDLSSVKTFAKNFKRKYERLHVLINNAGILGNLQRKVTRDGLEAHFAVNYLGAFYLTNLLLDVMRKTEESRVITVSSSGQEKGKFNWDDLMFEKNYNVMSAYSQSKLASVTFTKTLQKRLNEAKIKSVSVHPGYVRTDGFRHLKEDPKLKIAFKVGYPIFAYFTKSSEQGAQTSIYCTMEDFKKLEGGAYYVDCKTENVNPEALKEENQRRLWEVSEKILKEKVGEKIWEIGSQ